MFYHVIYLYYILSHIPKNIKTLLQDSNVSSLKLFFFFQKNKENKKNKKK